MNISEEKGQSVVRREKWGRIETFYLYYLIIKEKIYFLSNKNVDEENPKAQVQKAILPDHLRFDGSGTHIKLLPAVPKQ